MAIEVIVRHEFHKQWYEVECQHCHSKLAFKEADVSFEGYERLFPYSLVCPVCGIIIYLNDIDGWIKLEEEPDGN